MAVIRNWNVKDLPDWVELKFFERHVMPVGEKREIKTGYSKCGIFVYRGRVDCTVGDEHRQARACWLGVYQPTEFTACQNFNNGGDMIVEAKLGPGNFFNSVEFYVYGGDFTGWWTTANFCAQEVDNPYNYGDPTGTYQNTNFDYHFHDNDEYWICVEGSGVIYEDGKYHTIRVGDGVATPRGMHHTVLIVDGFMRFASFGGRRRAENPIIGFQWEHTHGKPRPID